MIIIRTLKQTDITGYETLEASNGIEALELIEAENPDLVLCDWNMPGMKGIELLQRVRLGGNNVSFGFITSECSSETRKLAETAGADFLVTKPFNSETLETALAPVVG